MTDMNDKMRTQVTMDRWATRLAWAAAIIFTVRALWMGLTSHYVAAFVLAALAAASVALARWEPAQVRVERLAPRDE